MRSPRSFGPSTRTSASAISPSTPSSICSVDGIAERLRPGQRREAVLAAWGIGEDGRKSLLGLMAGSKEDVETVRAFFQDPRIRGLGDPLLVVSDGASGIIRAIEECFPDRRASVASHTGCAISRPRSRRIHGRNLKARVTACYQRPRGRLRAEPAAGIRRRLRQRPV